jgi:CelD/BcsL family acetyltransferase involved in cellulose biosynthesis
VSELQNTLSPDPRPLSVLIDGIAVGCFTSIESCQSDWVNLEKNALGTYYQTFDWCQAWQSEIGVRSKTQPVIIIGKSTKGEALFILPLQLRKRFGFTVLEWLTQPENNYGQGLFCKSREAKDWENWLNKSLFAVLALVPSYDVATLINMPDRIFGTVSPLSSFNRFVSADQSFMTQLQPNFEKLQEAKRSSRSISKIRRRDERLAELGSLNIQILSHGQLALSSLQEALELKELQLAEMGVHGFATRDLNAFFGGLIEGADERSAALHVFRLQQSGKTISSLVGASYAGTFWLMILSMSQDGPLQFSPGDYILRKSIAWACENNLQYYDFGMGQSQYKEIWADQEIQLYNYFAAKTLKGLPLAALFMFYNAGKRLIKNTPALKSFFFQVRKVLRGKKAA